MRSVHFTVDDEFWVIIQRAAEEANASVAHWCRVAAIGRSLLSANRAGYKLADLDAWQPIFDRLEELEHHDIRLQARNARERRQKGKRPRFVAEPSVFALSCLTTCPLV
jgi:hypothetical protein